MAGDLPMGRFMRVEWVEVKWVVSILRVVFLPPATRGERKAAAAIRHARSTGYGAGE